MQNLENMLSYYVKGIMMDYNIEEKKRAEEVLAAALQDEKVDIAITAFVKDALKQ